MSVGRTVTDLSHGDNARECAEEFRRARDGLHGSIAAWAGKWGDALVANLRDPEVSTDDLEKAEAEATQLEADNDHMKSAIQDAIDALDDAAQLPVAKTADAYEKIASDLEKSLIK